MVVRHSLLSRLVPIAGPILIAVFGLVSLAHATVAPETGSTQVAALFAPWTSDEAIMEAVIAADARIIRFGAWNTILIVDLNDATQTIDGAVLLNPKSVAVCFTDT